MHVEFSEPADKVERALFRASGRDYEALWDLIDRIADDPAEAAHRFGTEYVSTRRVYGTKVPRTTLTVFWRISTELTDVLEVAWILDDPVM